MPNKHNQQQLIMLQDNLSRAKAFAIVDYQGTTVSEQVRLRSMLQQAGAQLVVAKNTLVALALKNDEFADSLKGMNAFIFSYQDEVEGFKQIVAFHEDTKKLVIKRGLLDDRVLSSAEILELSKLPTKHQLIGMLLARLNGPAFGLVSVLKASQRKLVYVLKAISEKEN